MKDNEISQICSVGYFILFKKYDILGFISECYDILHLNGYACVLHDVENLLKNRGVTV